MEWTMANGNQVQQQATLGCGSLILIALIVIIFSKEGSKDLGKDVQALGVEIKGLKQSVESQSTQIRELRETLEKAKLK